MSKRNLIRLIIKISIITSLITSIIMSGVLLVVLHFHRQYMAEQQQEAAAAASSQALVAQENAAAEAASAAASQQAAAEAASQGTAAAEAGTQSSTESSSQAATEASTEASTEAETSQETSGTEASGQSSTTYEAESGITLPDGVVSTYYGSDALMQIVAIGDSQFGNFKGYDGVAHLLSDYCHANVYNMAVGGSCAAALPNDSVEDDSWDNYSGVGMAKLFAGDVSTKFLENESTSYQLDVYQHCDLQKTDVFVVEYGVNDFLARVPLDKESGTDVTAYRSALRYILEKLRRTFPDAVVVLCSPSYAQFFDNGVYIGDSNTLDLGYGKLINYVNAANNLVDSNVINNCWLMNPYYTLGINAENARDNLIDGIHMNASYRDRYTQMLSRLIIRSQGYSIGQDVDPSTVEWWTTKSE